MRTRPSIRVRGKCHEKNSLLGHCHPFEGLCSSGLQKMALRTFVCRGKVGTVDLPGVRKEKPVLFPQLSPSLCFCIASSGSSLPRRRSLAQLVPPQDSHMVPPQPRAGGTHLCRRLAGVFRGGWVRGQQAEPGDCSIRICGTSAVAKGPQLPPHEGLSLPRKAPVREAPSGRSSQPARVNGPSQAEHPSPYL